MSDLSLSLVLRTLDQGASRGLTRFTSEFKGLSREAKAAPAGWLQTKAAIDKTTVAADRWAVGGKRDTGILGRLAQQHKALRHEIGLTGQSLDKLERSGSGRRGGGFLSWLGMGIRGGPAMAAAAGAVVGTAAVAGATTFGKGVIATGGQFETYRSRLKTLDNNDAGQAAKDLSWITDFARKTPYNLDQVTESFITLKSAGIQPVDGSLRSLGDAAAAMGKPIQQAVDMMTDAQMGEFERLKEFQVQAQQQGDRVTFTYQKAGKAITVTSKKSAAEIRRTLLGIFDSKFTGAMDEQSRTWMGMTSALGDHWTSFKRKVADGGAFAAAEGHLQHFLSYIESKQGQEKLNKWAGQASTALTELFNAMAKVAKAVDWVQLAKDIGTTAHAIGTLADTYERLRKLGDNPVGRALRTSLSPFGQIQQAGDTWTRLRQGFTPARRAQLNDTMAMVQDPVLYNRRNADAARRQTLTARGAVAPGFVMQQAKLNGQITIGLAPGMRITGADFGGDIAVRRGTVGGQP